MRYLVLFATVVLSGCFFVPAAYTETVECWDCGEPVYTAPVKTAPPVSAPLPSPFGPVVPVKTATDSMKLRPSPYGESSELAPAKTTYDVIKTVRVEFENGGTVILNNFDARNPNPPTPPPSKTRRTKRPAKRNPAKVQCPAGCCKCPN